MENVRRLALQLHSLHREDRAWLLAQLEDEPKRQLTVLLNEIDAIGLQSNPELLTLAADGGQDDGEPALRIGMASGAAAYQVLRNEPMQLRRCLSQMHNWPWLRELDQEQRLAMQGGVEPSMRAAPLTPRARQALLQAFASNLAEVDLPPSVPTRPSISQRLRKAARWPR